MNMRRHPYRDTAGRHERLGQITHKPSRQVRLYVTAFLKNVHLAINFYDFLFGYFTKRVVALLCDTNDAAVPI